MLSSDVGLLPHCTYSKANGTFYPSASKESVNYCLPAKFLRRGSGCNPGRCWSDYVNTD